MGSSMVIQRQSISASKRVVAPVSRKHKTPSDRPQSNQQRKQLAGVLSNDHASLASGFAARFSPKLHENTSAKPEGPLFGCAKLVRLERPPRGRQTHQK